MTAAEKFICTKCTPQLKVGSNAALYSHTKNYHANSLLVIYENEKGEKQSINILLQENGYECPICHFFKKTSSTIRKHLKQGKDSCSGSTYHDNYGSNSEKSSSDDELQAETTVATISTIPLIPAETSTDKTVLAPRRRTFDEAVLYACQMEVEAEINRNKTLWIIENLNLKPFAIIDHQGVEHNGLANEAIIPKITTLKLEKMIHPILPTKRKWDHTKEISSSTIISNLFHVIHGSPYSKVLLQRNFVEIDNQICTLLNDDWIMRPQMRYFCAQILAGAVLVNEFNGQAIILNCIEIYGRTKSVDKHREKFVNKKGLSPPTSLPPVETRYPNVWPCTVSDGDGIKLIIGTHTFNALVTSSLRIDKNTNANIGPMNASFVLQDENSSLSTRIFLDRESMEKALQLTKDENAKTIENFHLLYQLRQLRSHYHHWSTYLLCRSSSCLTISHNKQPYTIFTLADYDNGKDKADARIASKLFRHIATYVLKSSEATLKKDIVYKYRKKCAEGKIAQTLDDILSLFPDQDDCSIPIIGNKLLDIPLRKLAFLMSGSIANANKSIAETVLHTFSN